MVISPQNISTGVYRPVVLDPWASKSGDSGIFEERGLRQWHSGVPSGEGQKVPTQENYLGQFTTPRTWMTQKLDLFSVPESTSLRDIDPY